jgi:hypothetical protein
MQKAGQSAIFVQRKIKVENSKLKIGRGKENRTLAAYSGKTVRPFRFRPVVREREGDGQSSGSPLR